MLNYNLSHPTTTDKGIEHILEKTITKDGAKLALFLIIPIGIAPSISGLTLKIAQKKPSSTDGQAAAP